MCRGFLWYRRGAEQNTDRLWTVAVICITQRGPRTEHFCSYCPFVALEFLLCHEMPLSVLTHIVQAYARVPQDQSLLTFPMSRRWALRRAILLLYPGAFKSWLRAMGCAELSLVFLEAAEPRYWSPQTSMYVANSTWFQGGLRRGRTVWIVFGC
jgi:hypothetical protein